MSSEIALNELSIENEETTISFARSRLKAFLDIVKSICQRCGSGAVSIRTPRAILSKDIARNYNLYKWLGEKGLPSDDAGLMLTMLTSGPYIDDKLSIEEETGLVINELKYNGKTAIGIFFAYLKNGITISIPRNREWDKPFLIATKYCIKHNKITDCEVRIMHVAAQSHIESHCTWFDENYEDEHDEYSFNDSYPPSDKQTILLKTERFVATTLPKQHGRTVYKEIAANHYWYVDNYHNGRRAHLEVFDREGRHVGEASLDGQFLSGTSDRKKSIDI